jgi:hypothetical protein
MNAIFGVINIICYAPPNVRESTVSSTHTMDELTQKEFLEAVPPGRKVFVKDFESSNRQGNVCVRTPEIELHCPNCNGERFFAATETGDLASNRKPKNTFLNYVCRNCRRSVKTYALAATYNQETSKWAVFKYGEHPSFGPPTPARAITLIGADRDQFLKGRRCENQGLGVGAFVYYRRVVENQKNRIFDEILRVSQHLGVEEQLLSEVEAAKKEVQFTKAVEAIKHSLPQSLLVNGHNPLLLLHSALSAGVHELTDEQCLELASSIRVVLVEFAERLSLAMKDEAELQNAVNRLTQRK